MAFLPKNLLSNESRRFLKQLIILSLPIMLQEFISGMVNFADIWMVGQLGVNYVNAVGFSGRLFFLFIILIFGVNSGSGVFMGQFWGSKNSSGIYKVMGIAFISNLIISLLFSAIAIFAPVWFLGILTSNEYVIALGVPYLRVMSISYLLSAVSATLVATLRAIRQTKLPMFASAIALTAKILLNILFIFVLEYGIIGAAFATIIARIIEIALQLILIKRLNIPILAKPKAYFTADPKFILHFFKVTLPIIANEGIWALGVFMYDIFYQFAGNYAQGAVQISENLSHMFLVFGISAGAGAAVIISNTLGEKDTTRAISYAKKSLFVGIIFGIVLGLLIFALAPIILSTYNVDESVRIMARNNLYVVAIMAFIRITNYFFIISILRSGGDTLYCLIVDVGCVWFIGVPMAFLGAYVLQLPIYFVVAMVNMEELAKFLINIVRFKQNKWANTLV